MSRARRLWSGINRRCDPNSSYARETPTYAGCVNGFKDFDEFKSWAESNPGFYKQDYLGKFWHIDKDLREPGNKVYSPEKCIFVPARINTLFGASNATRGKWPIGAYKYPRRESWSAQCSDGEKTKFLGCFDSPEKAHKAWQAYKAKLVFDIALNYQEISGEEVIKLALIRISNSIMADLEAGRETFALTEAPSAGSQQGGE